MPADLRAAADVLACSRAREFGPVRDTTRHGRFRSVRPDPNALGQPSKPRTNSTLRVHSLANTCPSVAMTQLLVILVHDVITVATEPIFLLIKAERYTASQTVHVSASFSTRQAYICVDRERF